MSSNNTRLFLTTYEADYIWLHFLLSSIEKYASGFSGITIVCDNDKDLIPQKTIDIVKSIPLDIIYVDPPTEKPPAMEIRIGYMWQQVIKLGWWKYCDEDVCIQVDSDCIFKQSFTPDTFKDSDGKITWNYRPWQSMNNTYWLNSTLKLLGLSTLKNQGMIGECFVLNRQCTKKLIEYISNKPAELWGWDFCIDNNIQEFSEYCLYGAFIENIYKKHEYSLKLWANTGLYYQHRGFLTTKYRSYDGLNPKINQEYESYLE